ncbi:MAG: alpha/beta hydrolase [Beijerinckiaceae bacterium]|nr:alpha/beta hydrolase [Beijerinckiaceae bacterium]
MNKFAITVVAAGALLGPALVNNLAAAESVSYHVTTVRGLDIFYREAGPASAQTVLLLHGFPSSSHMFRDLIPVLATKYHVIAPDYPGFGHSSAPPPGSFQYTFANLAVVVDEFTQMAGLNNYVIYMQDYGGPVGFRLALKNPDKVRGLIVQNAVVNVEGWNPEVVASFSPAWQNRTPETEKPLRAAFNAEATKFQYTHGVSRQDRINPDAWVYDQTLLDRPGNDKIQVELLYQYKDNVTQYPAWQQYLKAKQLPVLVVWGNNDPFFTAQGRDFFKNLVPAAEVHSYDAGHFALETHWPEIASAIREFLGRLPGTR